MPTKCRICGKTSLKFLFKKGGVSHLQCLFCGLGLTDFSPPRNFLTQFYSDDYYRTSTVKRGYVDYASDEVPHRTYFRKKLAKIKKLRSQGKLLDVGSALGFLLVEAQGAGYDASGLEISDYAIKYAKEKFGVRTQKGFGGGANLGKGQYDVVTLIQTLEHIPDPYGFLKWVYEILKPGGILLVATPNHESFWRGVLGKSWFQYKPQEHLFYFTPKSIQILLENSGFKVPFIKSDEPMGFRLERILERFDYYWNFPLAKPLKIILKTIGLSELSFPLWLDDLEVIAQK